MPMTERDAARIPRIVVVRPVAVANTWRQRAVGLMGRRRLTEHDALFFPRCRTIHTCFMRVPMDAVFVSRAMSVVQVFSEIRPFRFSPPVWQAWGVLELAAGMSQTLGIQVGDQLRLEDEFSRLIEC